MAIQQESPNNRHGRPPTPRCRHRQPKREKVGKKKTIEKTAEVCSLCVFRILSDIQKMSQFTKREVGSLQFISQEFSFAMNSAH
jgi:hypothetical protein